MLRRHVWRVVICDGFFTGYICSVFLQDIFVQNIDVKWDDIIGLDHAKRLSKEAVVYPIKVSLDLIKVSNKSQKRMFSFDKSLNLIKNVHMNQRYVIVS